MSDDLSDWLLERIAEDEAAARDFVGRPYHERWDQTRVLAECAAKRRIITEHPVFDLNPEPCCRTCGSDDGAGSLEGDWPCLTLRLLALPLANHPGYLEEWRP